jgi:hypothetical protein
MRRSRFYRRALSATPKHPLITAEPARVSTAFADLSFTPVAQGQKPTRHVRNVDAVAGTSHLFDITGRTVAPREAGTRVPMVRSAAGDRWRDARLAAQEGRDDVAGTIEEDSCAT